MVENKTIWSLTVRTTYRDGSTRESAYIRDFGTPRFVSLQSLADTVVWMDIRKTPIFKQFLAAAGLVVGAGTPPATVNDYEFRFMAMTTNGGIHVVGTNKQLTPGGVGEGVAAVYAALQADVPFYTFMNFLAA